MSQAVAHVFLLREFTETSHVLPVPTAPAVQTLWVRVPRCGGALAALVFGFLAAVAAASRPAWCHGDFLRALLWLLEKRLYELHSKLQNIARRLPILSGGVPLAVCSSVSPLDFAYRSLAAVFCAAVCPARRACRNLVLPPAGQSPPWWDHIPADAGLDLSRPAVGFAVTGGGFIICQYDPFVPIFRPPAAI